MTKLILPLLLVLANFTWAMDIGWTRMTGQYPVECSPVQIETGSGPALMAINRGGQVMLWSLSGADMGAGPDGVVAELPEDLWSSSPAVARAGQTIYVFCSDKGHVVALDGQFRKAWDFELGAAASYGAATAVNVTLDGNRTGLCLVDDAGSLTCLDTAGNLVWRTEITNGPCKAPLQVKDNKILATSGHLLCCLAATGELLWSRDLAGSIISRPEFFNVSGRDLIFCGAGAGNLVALTPAGEIVWQAEVGDEIDSTIALLPRPDNPPLILCKGLWGNVYAFDEQGHHVWTYCYRAKSRSKPLVLDFNLDGKLEVLITAYNQHVYLLDDKGRLLDDLRTCGCINGSPVRLNDGALIVTAALQAQLLSFSPPASPYGDMPVTGIISYMWPEGANESHHALEVQNPAGALLIAQMETKTEGGERWINAAVTARSAFELPFPKDGMQIATISDCTGRILLTESRTVVATHNAAPAPAAKLMAWPTAAYGAFDGKRLTPSREEVTPVVSIPALYVGESDQSAFVIASDLDEPCRVRVRLGKFARIDGETFGGKLKMFEVVTVGTYNGDEVPDALVALNDAGTVQIPAKRAVKVWVSVDAEGAKPGEYAGDVTISPLQKGLDPLRLALKINVLNLEMKRPFPLALCTWDYIPNKWFPDHTDAVLEDMTSHGVNIFPRTACIPKAVADGAGKVSLDFAILDQEADRLKGKGIILLQLGRPNIIFSKTPTSEAQHAAEIEYLHQLRDHLKEQGWNYNDYAFYPLDEPGLDFGKNLQILIDAATLFREADPQFRIYTDPVPTLSKKDFDKIAPLIDVWCPNMRLVSGLLAQEPRIKNILGSGKTVWSYECVGQVKSISPLRYNRAAAWRGNFFGLSGIGFWTYSTTEADHWFAATTNDEYALVYPGTLPVPSVRWEAVRDGLEDVAAIKMLQGAISTRSSDAAYADLVKQAGEELRIAQTDILEMSDQAFIESRDYLKQGDRIIPHTWTDVGLYSKHRKQIAELTLALMR